VFSDVLEGRFFPVADGGPVFCDAELYILQGYKKAMEQG
jgi:hypothetical protein